MNASPALQRLLCSWLALLSGCGFFLSDKELMDPDGDGSGHWDDCDDERGDVYPGAPEVWYDGVDNDCDSATSDVDADADGHAAESMGGDDCADNNAAIYPGAVDLVDDAGVDEDCDGLDGVDGDQDSYASTVSGGPDCDDTDSEVNPDAVEVCDELDNDCDGQTDDSDSEDATLWYKDQDDDGFGVEAATTYACSQPDGYVLVAGDCDDENGDARPDGAEEPYNETDDDCDPNTPDDDLDADGYGAEVVGGVDCDDADAEVSPEATELCDEVDNDCDDVIDEDDALDVVTWYADVDGDGFGDATSSATACTIPSGYVAVAGDCDDDDSDSFPGGTEEPYNGADDDCDSATPDDDLDGDGFGAIVLGGDDCDDTDTTVSPDATESCDEVDNDCDGKIDEEDAIDAPTWYIDGDSDGFGDPKSPVVDCDMPSGTAANASDCDDQNATAFPGGTEFCDDADNDCDGTVDNSAADAATWYKDADADGYGDKATSTTSCAAPTGYVADDSDCNDATASAYPSAIEYCNELDDDCDGDSDEGAIDSTSWYADTDADTFGDPTDVSLACAAPSGYVAENTDCDDADGTVNPTASEACGDGIDQDCDGSDTLCPYSGDFEGPSDADVVIAGDATCGDNFGRAAAGGFDTNGDGNADLLVGTPTLTYMSSSTYTEIGAAQVYIGPLSEASPTCASSYYTQYRGQSSYSHHGSNVWGISDLDGDGYDEIAVHGGRGSPDEIAVYFGPASSGAYSYSAYDLRYTYVVDIANAGDIDGSGVSGDLIVGGDHYGSEGYVELVEIDSAGTETTTAWIVGETTGDRAGVSVAGDADFDGDGQDDVLVGASGSDLNATDAGTTYMVIGPLSTGSSYGDGMSLADADAYLMGENSGDNLGTATHGLGDPNGDGYDDFLVVAPFSDANGSDSGTAYVVESPYSLTAGSRVALAIEDAAATILGSGAGDGLGGGRVGLSVSGGVAISHGDVDGDREIDILIGAPGDDSNGSDSGACWLLYGPVSGTVDLSASYSARFLGGSAGDSFCNAGAIVGDTNSDGFDDILVGAPDVDSGLGAAYLFLGR